MTAVAQPPVATAEALTQAPLAPAEGLELLGEVHGSGYKDGACLVRRADGQMVQLGPLMFALLECADGRRDVEDLANVMTDRLGRQVEVEHVLRLAEKLAEQGLLAGSEHKAPPKSNPLLALRWKYLVTDPKVTRRITRPFIGLFRSIVVWPILLAFLGVFWFVLLHKGIASAAAQAFQKPELLLLVFALGVASAGFHEIGHASACRYGGGRPGGMGVGLYMVWPAFYTDVTDAYRLPKRDRLRVDLGGLYFNSVVAVATLAAWLALRVDALLLLVGLQLLTMVKQLSPVIRADGYHILADATGVPDLYAHLGPTLRRLLPGHRREPSALSGKARALVTVWVLLIVPILLSLSLTAIVLFPKIVATAWESGSSIASAIPDQLSSGDIVAFLASLLRLFALLLPVLGTILMGQKTLRMVVAKAGAWSEDRPGRRAALGLAAAGLACLLLWCWWPSGQYQPIRASDNGTLFGLGKLIAQPRAAVRPALVPAAAHLAPGKHLAVAMIPRGGATKGHPAFFMIKGAGGQKPVMIVSDQAPDPRTSGTPALVDSSPSSSTEPPVTTSTGSTPGTPTATTPNGSSTSTTGDPVTVAAFQFQLPDKPRPQDSQALAVNTKDGAVKYDVVYSIVTVTDGKPVDSQNTAYAFANCNACTTYAVSFQLVLIVGTSNVIAPINFAGALNGNCPACVTLAIADQMVVTLKSAPTDELIQRLNEELTQLDAIKQLADSGGTPDQVASQVGEVQHEIETELNNSGLLAKPLGTSTTGTSTSTPGTTTPTSSQTTTTGSDTSTSTTTSPGTTTDSSTTTTPTDTSTSTTTSPGTTTDTGTTTAPTDTSTTQTTTTDTSTGTTPTSTTTDTTTTS
jgi:putative peptide zinc metalloprotease protein